MQRNVVNAIVRGLRTFLESLGAKRRRTRQPSRRSTQTPTQRPTQADRAPRRQSPRPERSGEQSTPRRDDLRVDPGDHVVLPDTDLTDVTIVYSPMQDGDPDPGEVVWTWVAFEDDPSQGKDRPVIVIGRQGDYLAAVQLSSKRRDGRDDYVPVGTGDWDPQRRPSWAKIERVLTIEPAAVRREGATLQRDRFDDLVAALQQYHRSNRH